MKLKRIKNISFNKFISNKKCLKFSCPLKNDFKINGD